GKSQSFLALLFSDRCEFEFSFAQLLQEKLQFFGYSQFVDAGVSAVGISKRSAMERVARGHNNHWQIMTTRFERAQQCDRVTVAAVDNCEIELAAPAAANLQGVIDIVPNQDFCANICERFSYDIFEVRILCEQESEADVHLFLQFLL